MRLTDIRIKLCESQNQNNRLKAFCALTFDNTFVIRDVKLIEGNDGLFLAMPSRKLADHCPRCGEKNHLRARFCNNCGSHLDESRFQRYQNGNGNGHGHMNGNGNGNGHGRLKLHADIAHPINAECRQAIEREVVTAFHGEVERSKEPGYIPPSLDGEDMDFYDSPNESASRMRLRPTGTTSR
ncbi:MAG: spoVG [Phycisphaerales bacterium]|nr:spoVG [Phycisphaerales bacterium]